MLRNDRETAQIFLIDPHEIQSADCALVPESRSGAAMSGIIPAKQWLLLAIRRPDGLSQACTPTLSVRTNSSHDQDKDIDEWTVVYSTPIADAGGLREGLSGISVLQQTGLRAGVYVDVAKAQPFSESESVELSCVSGSQQVQLKLKRDTRSTRDAARYVGSASEKELGQCTMKMGDNKNRAVSVGHTTYIAGF